MGHCSLQDQSEPLLIAALGGIKMREIAVGGWHSCALSTEGDLYTWGWNSHGQLGLFDKEENVASVLATPQVVDFEGNICKVACGSRHTVIILGESRN